MPTAVGPNIKGEENLAFGYDLSDTRNSFKGKPATNILKFLTSQYSDYNQTYFKVTNGTHIVDIPTLGPRTVKYIDVWNDYYGGSGNCCLGLFAFGTSITVTGGTDYMYQIIYKTDTGYTDTNYMYHYEYGASGYLTEYGLHSTSRRTHLGDGWYHAWGGFTTNASATYTNTYLFHYEYATLNRIQVAGVMLTQGTQVIPPDQFIGFEQTRSVTQGLLDLTGNLTIDLTNVSFDSNAQMTFDGSNDYISIPNTTTYGNFTAEVVIKPTSNPNNAAAAISTEYPGTNSTVNFAIGFDGSNFFGGFYNDSSGGWHQITTSLPTLNVYAHYVLTYNGTQMVFYKNGTSVGTLNTTDIAAGGNPIRIGRRWDLPEYFPGDIDVAKVYDRALTADEVRNNYRHYKTRFSI